VMDVTVERLRKNLILLTLVGDSKFAAELAAMEFRKEMFEIAYGCKVEFNVVRIPR